MEKGVAVKRDRNGFIRCRVCGCTELYACDPGCSWVDEDLCSVCAAAVDALSDWMVQAHRPNMAALRREVARAVAAFRRRYAVHMEAL